MTDTATGVDEGQRIAAYPIVGRDDVRVLPYLECRHVTTRQGRIVEKSLREGKRHFGVSAASLTWMRSPRMRGSLPEGWKPEVVDVAIDAENRTTRTLLDWARDKPAVVVIDSMHIPGVGKEEVDPDTGLIEGGDTDHILVIGSNVYVIDTKCWKKRARYTVGDNGQILRNGKDFPGGNVRINNAVRMWFDYIDSDDAELLGAIDIDNGDEEDPKTHEWSTSVFRNANWWKYYWFLLEPKRFISWLDEKYADQCGWDKSKGRANNISRVTTINPSIIAQIAVTCIKPYNRRATLINYDALKH